MRSGMSRSLLATCLVAALVLAARLSAAADPRLEGLLKLSETELAEVVSVQGGEEPMTRGMSAAEGEVTTERAPVAQNPLQDWLGQMAGKAREVITNTLNPKRDWFKLIRRMHDWFSQYKGIYDARQREVGRVPLMTPVDVLAVEFARADGEISRDRQSCPPPTQVAAKQQQQQQEQKSIETMDFLYDALDNLMSHLEQINPNDARQVDERLKAHAERTSEELRSTREFREAMERVKRIGLNTAEGVAKNEAMVLVRMALLNVLASSLGMACNDSTGSVEKLAELVVGATGHEMLVQYLADANRRLLVGLLGVLNPVNRYKELRELHNGEHEHQPQVAA